MVHIPRWRYWLSYLFEQRIEQTSSAHNPHLLVSLRDGQLQLSADQAIYSYGELYLNFRETFSYFRFELLPTSSEVLLLGLGLGSIPHMLERRFRQHYRYTAVEIDEVVLELASEYVLSHLKAPIDLYPTDALAFISQTARQFDLICMDIFKDAEVPPEFETRPFLHQLQGLLRPGGVLLFNRLADTPQHRKASERFYTETFLQQFPEATFIDSGGNLVLLNRPDILKNGRNNNT